MKMIARMWRGLYVLTGKGQLYYVPADGSPGYPVEYVAIEARSLWDYAAEAKQAGRRLQAKRYRKAARALERLAAASAA